MINRLLRIPLNHTDYKTEVNTVKYIAKENGYDLKFIENLIKNANQKKSQDNIQETPVDNNNKNYKTLTHHKKSVQKIAKRFKKKYNIAYTTNNTL